MVKNYKHYDNRNKELENFKRCLYKCKNDSSKINDDFYYSVFEWGCFNTCKIEGCNLSDNVDNTLLNDLNLIFISDEDEFNFLEVVRADLIFGDDYSIDYFFNKINDNGYNESKVIIQLGRPITNDDSNNEFLDLVIDKHNYGNEYLTDVVSCKDAVNRINEMIASIFKDEFKDKVNSDFEVYPFYIYDRH